MASVICGCLREHSGQIVVDDKDRAQPRRGQLIRHGSSIEWTPGLRFMNVIEFNWFLDTDSLIFEAFVAVTRPQSVP